MTNAMIPNSAAIPNILFDYWMSRLSPAEFKVLMAISRKIYGWNKTKDAISLKQLESLTGLSRKGICQCIESLIGHDLVIKIKTKTTDGDDAANLYEINVNCMGGGGELNSPGVENPVHQGVVNGVHTQKTLYTKDTIQNKYIAQTAPRLRKTGSGTDISFSFDQKKFLNISEADLSDWKKVYESIDIQRQIMEMTQWCLANPSKAKSKKLWRKFILGWLQRANEKQINRLAYQSSNEKQVLSRHTGLKKDPRPIRAKETYDFSEDTSWEPNL